MKYIPFIICLIINIIFLSCKKEEVSITQQKDSIIEFAGNYIVSTKGNNFTIDGDNPLMNFTAFINKKQENILHNIKVSRADIPTSWKYSPVAYWPNNNIEEMEMYAYAPHDEAELITVKGEVPSVRYSIKLDPLKQVDYLWGAKKDFIISDCDKPIAINFKHALTKIIFKGNVENKEFEDTYQLVKISLIDIYTEGISQILSEPRGALVWNIESAAIKKEIVLSGDKMVINNNLLSMAPKSLITDAATLFMMPQKINETAKISFEVYNKKTQINSVLEIPLTAPRNSNGEMVWETGAALVYTLILNDFEIAINVKITDWEDQIIKETFPALYLNVSESVISLKLGETGIITYSTNAKKIEFECSNNIEITSNSSGIIRFKRKNMTTGKKGYIKIKAGNIIKHVEINL